MKFNVSDVRVEDIKVGDTVTWGTRHSAHTVTGITEGAIKVDKPAFVISTGSEHPSYGMTIQKERGGFAIVTPYVEPEAVPATPLDVQIGGSHYKDMAIQPLEYCLANAIPFAEGNIIKYVSRWRKKNGVQDLMKARHMLDVLIAQAEKEASV